MLYFSETSQETEYDKFFAESWGSSNEATA